LRKAEKPAQPAFPSERDIPFALDHRAAWQLREHVQNPAERLEVVVGIVADLVERSGAAVVGMNECTYVHDLLPRNRQPGSSVVGQD
jgi:hypothetical protein